MSMATLMRRQTPYQVDIKANDLSSGKAITNILYYVNDDTGAHGSTLAGTDEATFLGNVQANWETFILPVLSVNYSAPTYRARAITGWRWPSPYVDVIGYSAGLTFFSVTTGSPHGLVDHQSVSITGTAGVTGLNAAWSDITVVSPTSFTVDTPTPPPGALTVIGKVQAIAGTREFVYEDNAEIATSAAVGSIAGDAVPLFVAASVRRINPGIGRSWRSHISLGPLGESQVENGRFGNAAFATFETAIDNLNTVLSIGGGFTIKPAIVSRKVAFTIQTPFPLMDDWVQLVSDFATRKNLGSIVSRKPRLTSVIA